MKRWKEMNVRFHLGIAAAFALAAALALALVYSFNQYKSQIIKEQEEQLLTIAKAVSNSISVYTDFYFADLVDVNTYDEYQTAGRLYLETGEEGPVRKFLTEHMRIQNEDVSNFLVSSDPENDGEHEVLIQGGEDRTYTSVNHFDGKEKDSRIDILRDEENQYYLGLSMPTLDGSLRLYFVINIERMYQKVASYIKVGQNGYVMIKDSTGRILMHPVKKQIGKDVISGREAMYPDFDLTELEQLIEHQKEGREAAEIYHSYWWTDQVPKRVKKIAAYTPVWFQDDFIIVSAVIDYDEIAAPISKAMISVSLLTIALMTTFVVVLYKLRISSIARTRAEQENEYLRELNSKLEELRRRQEQMSHDQRLQLMGTLTGGIAHEFNNLLTPIMGYSGMIMADSDPSEDVYDSAQEIYSAAEKAKDIIRQIAALSRKQQGSNVKPLNLKAAAERLLKIIDTVIPPNVHMNISFEWGDDCFVLCSETELNQIVLNLCTNAFYAMRSRDGVLRLGGRVITGEEAGLLFHAPRYEAAYASFWVEDNGEGIPEEQQAHIFDPFFTTKQVGEGTGLGLSTVVGILESLGGGIHVESRTGHGSRFTFCIPVCEESKEKVRRQRPSGQRSGDGARRILLVEDDKKILKLFDKALRTAGFDVTAIGNPLEAEEILRGGGIDVIVTDYAMPKMNGAQIASLARKLGLRCKVILITGLVEDQVLEYYQKNLIHALLLKPLECQTLIDAVNRELG